MSNLCGGLRSTCPRQWHFVEARRDSQCDVQMLGQTRGTYGEIRGREASGGRSPLIACSRSNRMLDRSCWTAIDGADQISALSINWGDHQVENVAYAGSPWTLGKDRDLGRARTARRRASSGLHQQGRTRHDGERGSSNGLWLPFAWLLIGCYRARPTVIYHIASPANSRSFGC